MTSPSSAVHFAVASSGTFFLVALVAGVWKFFWMRQGPEHRAPFYVDTAHRASLLYSFACLVLAKLAEGSPLGAWCTILATALPIAGFASAVATYVRLGLARTTENQFRHRTFTTTWGMLFLIVAEIGGFLVLFAGWIWTQLLGG